MAAAGSVLSAAGGAWSLPSNMLVYAHQNESILPANVAGPMRDFFTSGGGAGGGGGAPISINVSAVDARSFMSMLRDPTSPLTRAIAQAARNNDSYLRGILKR